MHIYNRTLQGITRLLTRLMLSGLLAGLLVAEVYPAGTLQPVEPGSQPMDFMLSDFKGNPHTLADYRGKIVAVIFWASWCPHCIKELPGMQRLQQKLADEPFMMLPVNVGEQKYRVWKFLKLINFTLPVLLDTHSKTFAARDASVLPTSFLLDTEDRIRYRIQGGIEWYSEEVASIIKDLVNEAKENTP